MHRRIIMPGKNPSWVVYGKNPTMLTYSFHTTARHRCASSMEAPSTSVCAFRLIGDYLNIGHSSQILFRCWSWFLTQPVGARRVLLQLERPWGFRQPLLSKGWQADLVRALNATYVANYTGVAKHRNLSVPLDALYSTCYTLWQTPYKQILAFPGYSEAWFANQDDAGRLVNAVLSGTQAGAPPTAPPATATRIGILNRRQNRTRTWSQAAAFTQLARNEKQLVVDEWRMEGLSLAEQVRSMRSFDLIIAPHGAQNVNFAFVRPCTVVLELFPVAYFLPMYLVRADVHSRNSNCDVGSLL